MRARPSDGLDLFEGKQAALSDDHEWCFVAVLPIRFQRGGGEHVRQLGGALFAYSAARLDYPQKSQVENIGKTLYGSWLNTRFSASVKALDIL